MEENRQKLSISRIPLRIKREFTSYADSEFCSDYGLCFKHVWDSFVDSGAKTDEIIMRIESLEGRVNDGNTSKESVIRAIDGSKIMKRRE